MRISAKMAVLICLLLFPFPVMAAGKARTTGHRDVMMNEDRFWSLIDSTTPYKTAPERQLQALTQALRGLSAAEIEAFERRFHEEQRRAYTWNLWGAASLINGGASDDGFEYFQRWLIAQGRKTFESAVADPDSLAGVITTDSGEPYDFEEFAYAASHVWQEKTGIDPWKDPEGRFPYTGAPPANEPAGKPFEETAEYFSRHYPRLWKIFGRG